MSFMDLWKFVFYNIGRAIGLYIFLLFPIWIAKEYFKKKCIPYPINILKDALKLTAGIMLMLLVGFPLNIISMILVTSTVILILAYFLG